MVDEAHPDFCWIHHVVEKPGYFRCGECFHWFADEQTLIEDDAKAWKDLGVDMVMEAEDIFMCPHCSHDF